MGLPEDDIESIANPPELTEEEEGLLDSHNQVQGRRKLSWDPKVLMERERQREYKGPTYADRMSEAYREVEERFQKLTTQAILAGKRRDGEGVAHEVPIVDQEQFTQDQDCWGEEEAAMDPAAPGAVVPEQPRIELVNLKMMDADELLHFVWGQERSSHAMFDVKRWVELSENTRKLAKVVDRWVHLSSAKGAKESVMTCEILEYLLQESLVDPKAVQAAVADEELQDILRAENMVMLKRLNVVLSRLDLPLIPGDDCDDEAGGDKADDDDELALLAELAAMRTAGGADGAGENDVALESVGGGVEDGGDGEEGGAGEEEDIEASSSTEPSLSDSAP